MNRTPQSICSPIFYALTMMVLLTAVYWPALFGGFIWDDVTFISDNILIQNPQGLWSIWLSHDSTDYWPLTYSLFWVMWRVFGPETFGYHLINVLVHTLNVLLIFVILRRYHPSWAFVCATLFAFHPVNVESVAWIFQLKTLFSTTLALLSLLFWLRDLDSKGKSANFYLLSVGCFVLSLLTKASVVTWPVVILGVTHWTAGLNRSRLRKLAPFFGLSGVMGLLNLFWYRYAELGGGEVVRAESWQEKILGAGWSFWFYWWKALVPKSLTFVYPRWHDLGSSILDFAPLVALVGVGALLWYCRRGMWQYLGIGLAYFAIVIFPVLGFADIYFMRYSLVADHWQYLALLGPLGLVAALLVRGLGAGHWLNIATVILAGVLGVLSFRQAGIYQSEKSVWQDTIDKNPDAWLAHNNLGAQLLAEGQGSLALSHFQAAVRLKPDFADAYNNIGAYYLGLDDRVNARMAFEKALQVFPFYARALNNMAALAVKEGRPLEGIEYLRLAIEHLPTYYKGYMNLGMLYTQTGQPELAAEAYKKGKGSRFFFDKHP